MMKNTKVSFSDKENMTTPYVSVIIPVYNVEKYLDECLKSVISQSLKNIEIICVNDGSTDGSLNILREYELNDPRIKIISGPNGGYGHALNVGIENATGDYIGIVESDDYIDEKMYEILYSAAKEHNSDYVKAGFRRFYDNEDERVFSEDVHMQSDLLNKLINPETENRCFDFLPTVCGIYKREVIIDNNILYSETPGASYQDLSFWFITLCVYKNVMFLDDLVYMYRQDNINSSINNKENIFAGIEQYRFIENELNKRNVLEKYNTVLTQRKVNNFLFTINRISHRQMYDFINSPLNNYLFEMDQTEIDSFHLSEDEIRKLRIIKLQKKFIDSLDNSYTTVYSTDNRYVLFCIVSIQSLIDKTDVNKCYSICVLYCELDEKYIDMIESMSTDNVFVYTLCLKDIIPQNIFFKKSYFSEAMFYRIMVPELFFFKNKVLYIDNDTIINENISEAFDIEFDNNQVIGAVTNFSNYFMYQYVDGVMKMDIDEYINSGVIMFNIQSFIDNKIKEECIEIIRSGSNFKFPDQDIINIVCKDKIKHFPLKWNYTWIYAEPTSAQYELTRDMREKYDEISNKFAILHFTTDRKPWDFPDKKYAYYFWTTARKTLVYEALLKKHLLNNSSGQNKSTTRQNMEAVEELKKEKQKDIKQLNDKYESEIISLKEKHAIEINTYKRAIDEIYKTETFKVGKFFCFIPRLIYRTLKGKKVNEE